MRLLLSLLALCFLGVAAGAETIPLSDISRLDLRNVLAQAATYRGVSALKLTEKESGPGETFAIVRNSAFRDGRIDLDVAGALAKTASGSARGFIGLAFHVQADRSRFEAFYIRPTNGRADDQLRRNHSTQYISVPDWPWERLRKESPGVYESYVDLVPGEWTHLRIEVQGLNASLYVGEASQPSLTVHDLKLGAIGGGVALWIGPGTDGYFRNLRISAAGGKAPAYGSNASAGQYVQTPDARIYYERYGEGGLPLVLLHGGEYGYIDEFGGLIREMSKRRTVIAIATRGYGRSERGTAPLSHRQFAQDAAAVIQHVLKGGEKADVLGFSEGAVTSYILASTRPELVNRLIAIGGPLGGYGSRIESLEGEPLTPEVMQKQVPDLVASRKQIMEKPQEWEPLIRELEQMYRAPFYVKQEEIRSIRVPTLIMAGDRDSYNRLEHLVDIYHMLPNGQLSFIPGCGHVVLDCKPELVISIANSFLGEANK